MIIYNDYRHHLHQYSKQLATFISINNRKSFNNYYHHLYLILLESLKDA
jgi:hypothetical protein